jgi:hypothetical protein
MIGRVPRVVSLWPPVVAWATLIFVLSSVRTLDTIDAVGLAVGVGLFRRVRA